MRTGNESLKIPVLDPHDIKDEFYHIVLSYVTADLNLKNLHMTGLSDYQVKEGKLHIVGLSVTVAFRWEKIVVKSEYDVNGVAANKYPIYGKGKLLGILNGLDVTCKCRMGLKNNKLYIANISSTLDLDSLYVKATGLYNDEKRSEEVSRKISEKGPEVIRKYPKEAGIIMSEVAQKKLNLVIGNKTLKELLDLLQENGGGGGGGGGMIVVKVVVVVVVIEEVIVHLLKAKLLTCRGEPEKGGGDGNEDGVELDWNAK
ncbi:hypothetical protein M0804_005684 [Polistes exclamans]|nr:hypothetical protein M0804_005684 [Polistes exclamans]